MKKETKFNLIVGVIGILLFLSFLGSINNLLNDEPVKVEENSIDSEIPIERLRTSSYTEIFTLHIDDNNSGNFTWAEAVLEASRMGIKKEVFTKNKETPTLSYTSLTKVSNFFKM